MDRATLCVISWPLANPWNDSSRPELWRLRCRLRAIAPPNFVPKITFWACKTPMQKFGNFSRQSPPRHTDLCLLFQKWPKSVQDISGRKATLYSYRCPKKTFCADWCNPWGDILPIFVWYPTVILYLYFEFCQNRYRFGGCSRITLPLHAKVIAI